MLSLGEASFDLIMVEESSFDLSTLTGVPSIVIGDAIIFDDGRIGDGG